MLLLGGLVFVQVVRDYLLLENFLGFRYRYVHATVEVSKQAAGDADRAEPHIVADPVGASWGWRAPSTSAPTG